MPSLNEGRIVRGKEARFARLKEGLVDELHLAIAPVLLGAGEPLLADLDLRALGYACTRHVASEHATHVVLMEEPAVAGNP